MKKEVSVLDVGGNPKEDENCLMLGKLLNAQSSSYLEADHILWNARHTVLEPRL